MNAPLTDKRALMLLERLATQGAMVISSAKAEYIGARFEATVSGCCERRGPWRFWVVSIDGYSVRLTLKDGEPQAQVIYV